MTTAVHENVASSSYFNPHYIFDIFFSFFFTSPEAHLAYDRDALINIRKVWGFD